MRLVVFLGFFIAFLAGCANHPLVDDMTGLATEDVVHKVRCEAAETVDEYSNAYGLTAMRKGLEGVNRSIKSEQIAYAERDLEVQEIIATRAARENELDRLNTKKQQLLSLVEALDQALASLDGQVERETDPQKLENLRHLIEKAGQRIAALTDESPSESFLSPMNRL